MSDSPPLSQYERRRREEILVLALDGASRRRWKRRAVKTVVACLIAAPLVTAVFWKPIARPAPPVVIRPDPAPRPRVVDPNPVIMVRIIDDPSVVRRLTLTASPGIVHRIGDEQLLSELAAVNEPAGLAWVNGKAELIYR